MNLLLNAVQAMPDGGAINVAATLEPNDLLRVDVSDTGKGIPKENMERIFEPFFSDKPPGEGTGLGLFVTRQLVEKLGGTIEVQSQVGVGTTVKIRLPSPPDAPQAPVPAPAGK